MTDAGDDDGWLDDRERGLAVDHVAPETRAIYDHLQRHLAAMPPPAGWQDRVLARFDRELGREPGRAPDPEPVRAAPRRARRRWLAAGAMVAAAAVVLVIVWTRAADRTPIALRDRPSQPTYLDGSDEHHSHDTVRIPGDPALRAVRIYRPGGALLASCPGDPRCAADGGLAIELPGAGRFEILGFTGCAPPPSRGDREADEAAAHDAGCQIVRRPPLVVR
ncbi:MAG TPA: hypothetical protein VFP84_35275 [Kofleriaceae bacterium]|nr:hypothetical protein [Kofleriaceae bacterium]